ncbi:MAG TPA: class I SAM-dependent methyltransferase [Chthoniobacterales bacterium]
MPQAEIASFQSLWPGGYYEGDPLDPHRAGSTYRGTGFVSALYATYLACIRPYITPETVALEIGPGRGAWTRTMLDAKEVWALDALSAEHNGIREYLGDPANLRYHQVEDFSASMLPDNHFDYMFSFGCLCHVSFEGITAYARNLRPKLKPGAQCFWMVGDEEKFNAANRDTSPEGWWDNVIPNRPRYALFKRLFLELASRHRRGPVKLSASRKPSPGRWYHAGAQRTAEMLTELGYRVHAVDVGSCLRDPIVHFQRLVIALAVWGMGLADWGAFGAGVA